MNAPGSNYLGNVEGLILEALKAAKGTAKESLENMAKIGNVLEDAKGFFKDNLEAGKFVEWAASQFGFAKAWTYRLMSLHGQWKDVQAAFAWAEGAGRDVSKCYSVDGALKLLAEWRVATDAEAAAKAAERAAKAEQAKAERESAKAKEETEAERLRRLIAKLQRENERLKAENEALKGGSKEEPKAERAKASPGAGAGNVSAADKARAKKIHGLYTRGATDGAKAAAKARLVEIAERLGMTFEAFMAACGLSV